MCLIRGLLAIGLKGERLGEIYPLTRRASFEVALFGFKGNALFVYLAQPNGLGKAVAERNIGPKA